MNAIESCLRSHSTGFRISRAVSVPFALLSIKKGVLRAICYRQSCRALPSSLNRGIRASLRQDRLDSLVTAVWRASDSKISSCASIAVPQKLMRHADIRTTMNIYGDVVTNQESEAHSKIVGLALPRA
jgi:integrase